MSTIKDWDTLETALIHIQENPDAHQQSIWSNECGTVRCVAGWVTHFGKAVTHPGTTRIFRTGRGSELATFSEMSSIILTGEPDGLLEFLGEDLNDILYGGGLDWAEILCNVAHLADEHGHELHPSLMDDVRAHRDHCTVYPTAFHQQFHQH